MVTLSAPTCTLQNCNVSAFHVQMKYDLTALLHGSVGWRRGVEGIGGRARF
jgi:hypothetical protein